MVQTGIRLRLAFDRPDILGARWNSDQWRRRSSQQTGLSVSGQFASAVRGSEQRTRKDDQARRAVSGPLSPIRAAKSHPFPSEKSETVESDNDKRCRCRILPISRLAAQANESLLLEHVFTSSNG